MASPVRRLLASRIVGGGVGGGDPAGHVVVLHGLLGSSRNWQGFTTALAGAEMRGTQFTLLDLRNHGGSTGFPPPHTLDACVDDVLASVASGGSGPPPTGFVGHSMGGKVLLQLARRRDAVAALAGRCPSRRLPIVIVDSLPGARPPATAAGAATAAASDSVARVLRVVESAKERVPSRAWVMEACAAAGIDRGTAAWLASCVKHVGGHPTHTAHATHAAAGHHGHELGWAFDPDTAAALYASYLATDAWDVLTSGAPPGVDLHLVIASKSSRWRDADTQARLAAATAAAAARSPSAGGTVTFTTIDAGHWVHVDNPAALRSTLATLLRPSLQ